MEYIEKWFPFNKDIQRNDDKVLVFCFHHAGGMASAYKKWINYNDSSIEFVPVELPGKGCRMNEKRISNINDLAFCAADAIRKFAGERKIILYGHSMGAGIAFQVAFALENKFSVSPLALIVSGRNAPGVCVKGVYTTDMDDEELINELKRMGGTSEEVLENPEMMEYLLPIIKNDYKLNESFSAEGERLKAPIYVYNGRADDFVNQDKADKWAEHTCSYIVTRNFEGNHFFLFDLGKEYIFLLKQRIITLRKNVY